MYTFTSIYINMSRDPCIDDSPIPGNGGSALLAAGQTGVNETIDVGPNVYCRCYITEENDFTAFPTLRLRVFGGSKTEVRCLHDFGWTRTILAKLYKVEHVRLGS